jgi:hypothetical protein
VSRPTSIPARQPDPEGALAALNRAALRAREEAIRTRTNLVVWRDGKMVIYSPADEEAAEE